ncbi:E3 ubiquitin-protein ligase RNFT1 [Pseudonaja textilis]|uniref:E3 ubiquitin-protein ligase RNFT1 n=1 Tax=Pseudonaja textilis TaxID=8673 RepID=A0A670YTF2_PSETE|nr:E3 ubiquitin-protein ligase RNFT1 [Pseudonaja textilis]
MQSTPNVRHTGLNNGHSHSPTCQGPHATRSPGEEPCQHAGDVHIQMTSAVGESEANAGSRQHPRLGTQSRPHGQTPGEVRSGHSGGPATEEQRDSSLSEFKYLLQWLHRSVPYILILSIKILMQHIIGISLGIGLLTTFMYANKAIVNQVFLRERCSRLRCMWLLLFLTGSSVFIYYTFYSQSLHYSLILLNPKVDFWNFWEVLWIVGITDFVLKFIFMSLKCAVLLLPCFIMSLKSKGYWYMLLEELCQIYSKVVPAPVWFRYFVGLRELDGTIGWSFGILLALLYLILKLLSFFAQLKNFRRVLRIFFTRPSYGVVASKRQRAEADDLCAICQAEFQKPVVLLCQHIFCDECIALWLNREKTCPLCRTVLSTHVNKWYDGATSAQLQLY